MLNPGLESECFNSESRELDFATWHVGREVRAHSQHPLQGWNASSMHGEWKSSGGLEKPSSSSATNQLCDLNTSLPVSGCQFLTGKSWQQVEYIIDQKQQNCEQSPGSSHRKSTGGAGAGGTRFPWRTTAVFTLKPPGNPMQSNLSCRKSRGKG